MPSAQLPALINADPIDNRAEIWRYRKDGSLPWERVYKAPADSGIVGLGPLGVILASMLQL